MSIKLKVCDGRNEEMVDVKKIVVRPGSNGFFAEVHFVIVDDSSVRKLYLTPGADLVIEVV